MLMHEGDNLTPSLKIKVRAIGAIRASPNASSPGDSVDVGLPNNRNPCLTCLDFQRWRMTVAANVVFQLVDRELLLDDQVPDEIAD